MLYFSVRSVLFSAIYNIPEFQINHTEEEFFNRYVPAFPHKLITGTLSQFESLLSRTVFCNVLNLLQGDLFPAEWM
jgi:hypothetical protein